MGTALSLLITALEMAPRVVSAGMDLGAFASKYIGIAKAASDEGRDPTAAEWAMLDADALAVHEAIQRL